MWGNYLPYPSRWTITDVAKTPGWFSITNPPHTLMRKTSIQSNSKYRQSLGIFKVRLKLKVSNKPANAGGLPQVAAPHPNALCGCLCPEVSSESEETSFTLIGNKIILICLLPPSPTTCKGLIFVGSVKGFREIHYLWQLDLYYRTDLHITQKKNVYQALPRSAPPVMFCYSAGPWPAARGDPPYWLCRVVLHTSASLRVQQHLRNSCTFPML